MQMHNRDDFEVYYFALDRDNKFVGKYVDNFVDLSVTPYRKVAVVIKELAIDVLINTMVPTDSWFRVAGLNPSFCQVSLAAGYPGTTGTKVVNYVISDRVISPPELQHLYVEKIAFTQYALHPLSQPIDFEGEVDTPLLTRESLGIPSDTFVFAYFESPQRETTFPSGMLPQTFAVWCSVLHRAPQSLLVLLGIKPESGTAQRVLKEGAVRGLAAVRFVFVSSNDLTLGVQEREVKELANLFLDNLGVNAQFAPSAFPWLGVPLLTLPGQSPFSRTGASIAVTQGRAMAGVAGSIKDFEDRAVAFNGDDGQKALSAERKAQLSTPIGGGVAGRRAFEMKAWVAEMEGTYRRLHRRIVRRKKLADYGK